MADSEDKETTKDTPIPSTPPVKEEDESNHISPSQLQACSLSPSPSTSNTSSSGEIPLKAKDSGVALEKRPGSAPALEELQLEESVLQNNDSGIGLEKSPGKQSPVEQPPLEQLTVDQSAMDNSEQASGGNKPKPDPDDHKPPDDDTSNMDEEEEEEEENDEQEEEEEEEEEEESEPETPDSFFRRRRRNQGLLDSSSDSDDEDPSSIDIRLDDTDSYEEESAAQAVADFPKDSWNPLREVLDRERGAPSRHYCSFMLRERTGASINLVRKLTLHKKLEHHTGCVNSLHFNSSGSLLASGSDDLNIVVWDWARGKPYFVFDSGHRSNVFQSKFMPHCAGDSLLVSCARDGAVRLAEFSSSGSCTGTKKLAQHRGAAHKLALLDDSPHMCYSCGEDSVVFQIDIRQSRPDKVCMVKQEGRKIPLYSIHSHPARTHEFCVGGRDPYIRIFDTRMLGEDVCVKKFCPHHLMTEGNSIKANVTCAVYNWNGTEVIGTYNDEDIYMFNTAHSDGANYTHRYTGHRNNATVKGVNFYGPKSEFIVSGSDCGNVFLWEKHSQKIVNYFSADEGGVVNVLEPHPHNPFLATSGLDHDIKIFLPTAEKPTSLDKLKQVMKRNHRDREDERTNEPDMIDGHMMWVLLQHLRRSARSQARQQGEDVTTSSSDDSDGDREEFEDSDGDTGAPPQCAPQ